MKGRKYFFGKKGVTDLRPRGHVGRRIPVNAVPPKPAFSAGMFAPHDFETRANMLHPIFLEPRVEISLEAYLDMYYITGYAGSNEVGWLGTVELSEKDRLTIKEIFLFRQEVTPSSMELSSEHIAEVATRLIGEGHLDKVNALKFWGHVHPANHTGASQQDDDTMDVLEDGNDWFLRGIFGRNGRAQFTLYDYKSGVRFDDVPWSLTLTESMERKEFFREQIEELVTPRFASSPPPAYGYGNEFSYVAHPQAMPGEMGSMLWEEDGYPQGQVGFFRQGPLDNGRGLPTGPIAGNAFGKEEGTDED
jgi:hypothetical protein